MKLVITGDLRNVIDSYNREEISYSKMAEILNNKANERLRAINYKLYYKSDNELLCRNCGSDGMYTCFLTDVKVCNKCHYQD